jgi:hypothetical protein
MTSKGYYIGTASHIPITEHWAIIENSSVTIPGDERSRTNPGHGYPEHTQEYITYLAFDNEPDFKIELEKQFLNKRSVIGIHVENTYQPVTKVVFVEKK